MFLQFFQQLFCFFLHVGETGSFRKPLRREEEQACFEALAAGDRSAREKLILSVALTAGRKTLTELGEDLALPVSPMTLAVQPSVGHWVLLYAMTRPEAALLRALAGPGHDEDFPDPDIGPGWDIRWVNDLSEDQADRDGVIFRAEEKAQADDGPEPDLSWRYPHLALADVPSKVTATQRKGRPMDQASPPTCPSRSPPSTAPALLRRNGA